MFSFLLTLSLCSDEYSIIIDAGSTKTVGYLYKIDSNSRPILIKNSSVSKPIYKVILTTSALDDLFGETSSITKLLDEVPEGQMGSCSFSIMSSALRLFPQDEVYKIFNATEKYLKDQNKWKSLSFDNSSFQVLSSSNEAVLWWISVNEQLGKFVSGGNPVPISSLSSSSLMIAYQSDGKKDGYHTDVKIRDQKYRIFSTGFDNYGMTPAIQNSSLFIASKTGITKIKSPCFLNDDAETLPFQDTLPEKQEPLLSLEGTGNFTQCYENFISSLLFNSNCKSEKCLLMNVPFTGTFSNPQLLSIFTYPKSFFGNEFPAIQDITNIKTFGENFCRTASMTDPGANEYYREYCYELVYMIAILKDVFRLPENELFDILTQIDGKDLTWTYGAVLRRALGDDLVIKSESDSSKIGTIIIAVLATLFFIGVMAYVIIKFCKRNGAFAKKEEENEPMINHSDDGFENGDLDNI